MTLLPVRTLVRGDDPFEVNLAQESASQHHGGDTRRIADDEQWVRIEQHQVRSLADATAS
jgi:hypothetical protein